MEPARTPTVVNVGGLDTMEAPMIGQRAVKSLLIAVLFSLVPQAWSKPRGGDAELRSAVATRLEREKLRGVTVAVQDGVATLDGAVDSVGNRERAAKSVAGVDGIVGVTNRLQIATGPSD